MRSALVKLHRCLGLLCGIVFLMVCLSGFVLLFEEPLADHLNGSLLQSARHPVSLDILHSAATQQLQKGERIQRIYLPPNRVQVSGPEGKRNLYFSPVDATFLGPGQQFMPAVVKFHRTMLLSDTGRWITLTSCLFVIFTLLSGLKLWLPSRLQGLGKALQIKRTGSRRRLFLDLHRVLGVAVALPLLTIAFTGLNYSKISAQYRHTIFSALGEQPPEAPKPVVPSGTPALSYDQLVERACQVYPEAELSCLEPGSKPHDPVKVRFRHPGQPGAFGQSNVVLHPQTGEVLRALNAMELPPGQQFVYVWALPLHRGEAFGWLHKLLWTVVVLAGMSLPLTGFWLWSTRSKTPRDRGNQTS